MALWKPKKIVFIGSQPNLLKILAKENETEVISSINFIHTLSNRFMPDLLIFESISISAILEVRKSEKLAFTPIVVLEDSQWDNESISQISTYSNVLLCNSSLCTEDFFISNLKKIMTKEKRILPAKTGFLVKKTIACINSSLNRKITREELARTIGADKDYLTRIFHREMGTNMWDYLNTLRMNEARQLLTYTGLSILEISARCGFNNSAYFCNTFRKKFGMAPGEIRK